MDTESVNIWCWIIPILVGVFSAYLGYLLGKAQSSQNPDLANQLKKLETDNAKLQSDLEACREKATGAKKKSASKTPSLSNEKTSVQAFDAAAAKAAMGKRIKQDDLKIVEGIGPKIEGLFHKFDIKTWKALSEISTDKCQEVLNSGGDRYRIHDPASWPMQAKMAFKGQWKELAKWQEDHKAGKF